MKGRGGLAAEAAVRLSKQLLDRDCNLDVVKLTTAALGKHPASARLWFYLGTAQRKLERMLAARQAYEQAIAIDPNYSQAYCNLGEWYLTQEEPAVALEHFDRALELQHDLLEALKNRASALYKLGRFADAQLAMLMAIAIYPRAAELYISIGGVLLDSTKTLPAIASDIERLITASSYNEALANIALGVFHHNQIPEKSHTHQYLYCPEFDRQIQKLSDVLVASSASVATQPHRDNTLIIATEMYKIGGHTRLIADIAREVHSPTVVLTGLFGSSHRKTPRSPDILLDTFEHAPVIALPQGSLWDKCRALSLLTQRLQPSNILYFNHHQDAIPFVGTLGHVGSRKTLIHHCDHCPSLGNSLAGIFHVDVTDERAQTCARHLIRETRVLPLYVPDAGEKRFTHLRNNAFSVVTSGSPIKFVRTGEMALQNIVHAVLTSVSGQFFHIGQIEEDWIYEIKIYLQRNGIDPIRYVQLGWVDSLWDKLASLDAHFYLGSAPVGGGRAAIEAQGCGYPVIFFRNEPGSVLAVDSLFASKQLGWTTLAELSALLRAIGSQQMHLSEQARSFYDQCYSREKFVKVLNEILIY